MEVIKRNGTREGVNFNKITNRLNKLVDQINNDTQMTTKIDVIKIAQKVCTAIYHGVNTQELDELSAEIAVSLSTECYDYGILAGYIAVSNMHKTTKSSFDEIIDIMYNDNVINDTLYKFVKENIKQIENKTKKLN